VAKKKAAKVVAKKKATEVAEVKKKAAQEAAEKKAAGEVAKKKASEEVAKKTASVVVTAGSSPSPASMAGVKRPATPSGSTPLAKQQFLGSWKSRYTTRSFICHFLFHVCDFNLVSPTYNVPSFGRSPPSRGPALRVHPTLLSPRTPSKPNRATRLSVAAGPDYRRGYYSGCRLTGGRRRWILGLRGVTRECC
jgi:hypothetical protein